MADRADDKARVFSFGMRQRLALAMCLLPRPELLVLDEPMDGLDPLAMVEFSDLLRRLRENHGMSIVLTSHQLAQLEELADHLLVLHDGRVVFLERLRRWLRNMSGW
jgi:ABC-type multidrug transport system ATPase subunit